MNAVVPEAVNDLFFAARASVCFSPLSFFNVNELTSMGTLLLFAVLQVATVGLVSVSGPLFCGGLV